MNLAPSHHALIIFASTLTANHCYHTILPFVFSKQLNIILSRNSDQACLNKWKVAVHVYFRNSNEGIVGVVSYFHLFTLFYRLNTNDQRLVRESSLGSSSLDVRLSYFIFFLRCVSVSVFLLGYRFPLLVFFYDFLQLIYCWNLCSSQFHAQEAGRVRSSRSGGRHAETTVAMGG